LQTEPRQKSRANSTEQPLDFIEQFRMEMDQLVREKEQSERKAAEYLDRLKRLQADMENLQKITRRQVEAVTRQASEGVLLKLLPILDALNQASEMAQSNRQLPPEEIAVGLRMLLKQFMEILHTEGLEEIVAVGQLDLERHEVVSFVEKDDTPENTIVQEIRKGYLLNGKVIRPSLVVVSKRGASRQKEVENPKRH